MAACAGQRRQHLRIGVCNSHFPADPEATDYGSHLTFMSLEIGHVTYCYSR